MCWYEDGIIAVTFIHKSKKASMIYYDSDYKKLKEHLLRKAHPRILRMLPGSELATVGYTYLGLIEFWNTHTSSCVYSIKAHSASVNELIFSRQGHTMYTSSENRAVKVWNIRKALEKHLPLPPASAASSDEFAPDSSEQLSIFKVLKDHETYATEVEEMLVLKGGKHLLTSYLDKPPVLWNLEKLEEKKLFQASDNTCNAL